MWFIAQHKSPQQGPKMLRAFIVGLLPFDYSLMVSVVKPPAEPYYMSELTSEIKSFNRSIATTPSLSRQGDERLYYFNIGK